MATVNPYIHPPYHHRVIVSTKPGAMVKLAPVLTNRVRQIPFDESSTEPLLMTTDCCYTA